MGLAGLTWIFTGDSIYALAVLVVASPCPLILATPIAIISGIDLAARNGIIIKSGGAIEQMGEVTVAVFDKTGTLTLGIPKVTTIVLVQQREQGAETIGVNGHAGQSTPSNYDENALLRFAASIEQLSAHILAHSIVEAAQCYRRTLSAQSSQRFRRDLR